MTAHARRPMTLTQKILCHHAVGLRRPWVETGEIVRIKVDWTIASELAWNGMNATYEKLGRPAIHDENRFYLALDHTVDPITLATDKRTQKLVQLSRDFAKEAKLRHFYDANVTIMHTKFYRDLVQPGQTVIGADSHTSSHGGLGALAIGLGGADVCVAMVLGETWIQVPEAIQVRYDGRLPFGLTGKDVILKTLGTLGRNTVAMERSVEYVGDALEHFSTDFRFTVANMTAEFGGLNGIFPADARTAQLLARRRSDNDAALYFHADPDAEYVARHVFDLARLVPQVAKPFSPDNVFDVDAVAGQPMQGVFIGACNTAEEELALAALVLRRAMEDGKTPGAVEESPGRPRLVGDHRESAAQGSPGSVRARGLPRWSSRMLHVSRHRQRQGGARGELAHQPESQFRESHGTRIDRLAGERADRRRLLLRSRRRRSSSVLGAHSRGRAARGSPARPVPSCRRDRGAFRRRASSFERRRRS